MMKYVCIVELPMNCFGQTQQQQRFTNTEPIFTDTDTNISYTCSDIGTNGYSSTNPSNCFRLDASISILCACTEETNDDGTDSTSGAVLIDESTTVIPTTSPTTTPAPTFDTECFICPIGSSIINLQNTVTIGDIAVTCEILQESAQRRFIPSSFCAELLVLGTTECGCTAPPATTTIAPTISPAPVTAFPTYTDICDLCPEEVYGVLNNTDQYEYIVNNLDRDVIFIAGFPIVCGDLVRDVTTRTLPTEFCAQSQEIVLNQCDGCSIRRIATADNINDDNSSSSFVMFPTTIYLVAVFVISLFL